MSAGKTPSRTLAYAALVTLLVAATLSGGDVFNELTGHAGHPHAGLHGFAAALPILADGLGFLLAFVLAIQMMIGYRLFTVSGSHFRGVHVPLAWTVAGLVALHATAGAVHTFQTTVDALPIWIVGIGSATVLVLALQLTSGYRRFSRGRQLPPWLHGAAAIVLALAVAVHSVLGIVHTFTG